MVPEFAVDYLPLGRTATMVPVFAVKDLPLGRTLIQVSPLQAMKTHGDMNKRVHIYTATH